MITTFEPDPCCGRAIIKASFEGRLEGKTEWECLKCGEVWKKGVKLVDNGGAIEVYHWQIVPAAAIIRR